MRELLVIVKRGYVEVSDSDSNNGEPQYLDFEKFMDIAMTQRLLLNNNLEIMLRGRFSVIIRVDDEGKVKYEVYRPPAKPVTKQPTFTETMGNFKNLEKLANRTSAMNLGIASSILKKGGML